MIDWYWQESAAAIEYFTPNAATPTPDEVNGTSGWSDVAGGPTITFTSVADPSEGTYAIRATTDTSSTGAEFRLALTNMENGASYTITYDAKSNHGNWRLKLSTSDGWTAADNNGFETTSYTADTLLGTTNSTTVYIRGEVTSFVTSGDYMTIDNIVVTKD